MTIVQRGDQIYKRGPLQKSVKKAIVRQLQDRGIKTVGDLKKAMCETAFKHGWDYDPAKGALSIKNLKQAINGGFMAARRQALQNAGHAEERECLRNKQIYTPAEIAVATLIGRHASRVYGDIYYSAQPSFDDSAAHPCRFTRLDDVRLPFPEDRKLSLNDLPHTNENGEMAIAAQEMRQQLNLALSKLNPPRYERALRLRFGLMAGAQYDHEYTLAELGQNAGMEVVRERGRQIVESGLEKLRCNQQLRKTYGR